VGTITSTQRTDPYELMTETLIGRRSRNDLILNHHQVSGAHAIIRWLEPDWQLRDLGSLNGTYINENRLKPGIFFTLSVGDTIAFGRSKARWTVSDIGPPRALALHILDNHQVLATDQLITLPDEASPELIVFCDTQQQWFAENTEGTLPVRDRSEVVVQGQRWRLALPRTMRKTISVEAQPLVLTRISMAFRVIDETSIITRMRVDDGDWTELPRRAHMRLFLLLARQRLADTDFPEPEQGWGDLAELIETLGLDRRHLNVLISRARQQMIQHNIADADKIIERRRGSGQVRLGISSLQID